MYIHTARCLALFINTYLTNSRTGSPVAGFRVTFAFGAGTISWALYFNTGNIQAGLIVTNKLIRTFSFHTVKNSASTPGKRTAEGG